MPPIKSADKIGSAGGAGGAEGLATRKPQSVQSEPRGQALYCEPLPPSSQMASAGYWHESLQPACSFRDLIDAGGTSAGKLGAGSTVRRASAIRMTKASNSIEKLQLSDLRLRDDAGDAALASSTNSLSDR
eukprot:3394142-Prymnesium_polylepis.1